LLLTCLRLRDETVTVNSLVGMEADETRVVGDEADGRERARLRDRSGSYEW
jgi:hypothetical protein